MATKNTSAVTKEEANQTSAAPAEENKDVNPVLRDHDIDALREEYKTKSAVIRFLASRNYARADIARALNIKYQHVRNVLVQDEQKKTAQAK